MGKGLGQGTVTDAALTPDEYVYAALSLYLDIVNLFLYGEHLPHRMLWPQLS